MTFGPRRLLTKSLRTVRVVCGDRFCDRRASGGTRVLDACPHLSRDGGCPAAVRVAAGYKRGPECIAGERRHRRFVG